MAAGRLVRRRSTSQRSGRTTGGFRLNDETRQQVEQIGRDLAQANYPIAFTGAGLSTESGLPDYRGASGLWKNRRFEELANIDAFLNEPVEFWEFYGHRIKTVLE